MRNNGPTHRGPQASRTARARVLTSADKGWTLTSEGDIPHLVVTCGDGTRFDAPVVLRGPEGIRIKGHSYKLARPLRDHGRLVYALPGGGSVCR